jgi:hypothetical protein
MRKPGAFGAEYFAWFAFPAAATFSEFWRAEPANRGESAIHITRIGAFC